MVLRAFQLLDVPTGFGVDMPSGYIGIVYPRMEWLQRDMLTVSNQVIANDFEGEICVNLTLTSVTMKNYRIQKGENVARIIFVKLFDGSATYGDGKPVHVRPDAEDMSFRGEPIVLPMCGGSISSHRPWRSPQLQNSPSSCCHSNTNRP